MVEGNAGIGAGVITQEAAKAAGMPIKPGSLEALIAAQSEIELVDTGVVILGVKKPQGSNYLKAIEIADGNATLVPFIEAMLCISTVNGDPQPTVRNKAQMYTLADKIGRASMDSLLMWFQNKAMPELGEVVSENPEITIGSPEFQTLIATRRAEKAKK